MQSQCSFLRDRIMVPAGSLLFLLVFISTAAAANPAKNAAAKTAESLQVAPRIMNLKGGVLEFKSEPVDGIYAMVHVSDERGEMKKVNSAKTHLLALRFHDSLTDQQIFSGNAALYFTNEHNPIGFFDPMKNVDGIFVSGMLITKPGEQQIIIASKLADKKTRDFRFNFTLQ